MHNPALTIGLSMVLGMLAQVGSKHLHLPGIVLLLLSGILFGPEASGLSNQDIGYSNYIFKIPVHKKFESLNLSHSLIIVCFEIFKLLKPSFFKKNKHLGDIASKKRLNIFLDFIETRLDKKGFFVPKEKKKTMLINLRNIFGRIELSNKELRILSSVFSKL